MTLHHLIKDLTFRGLKESIANFLQIFTPLRLVHGWCSNFHPWRSAIPERTAIFLWQAFYNIFIFINSDIIIEIEMSQSQLVWSFESQSRVKVKVVKWCRKKWNEHNLVYVYHKQWEIKQKFNETAQNSLISLWLSVEMVRKGPKLCKHKCFFLRLEADANAFFSEFSKVSRVCHRKADVQGFPKMWWFLLL